MYAIYSQHPKTYATSVVSLQKSRPEALINLKTTVQDYIMKVLNYSQVTFINKVDDMKAHPTTKYFVRISNESSNPVYFIYEQNKVTEKGYLYNGVRYDNEVHMIYSIMDIGAGLEQLITGESKCIDDRTDFVQKIKKTEIKTLGSHVRYIGEMKEFLEKHKAKYFRDSDPVTSLSI